MKRLFILLLISTLMVSAFAVPMERIRKTITLANGQQVQVTMHGDEDFSFMMTDNGYVVDEEQNGYVLCDMSQSTTMKKCAAARKNAPRRSADSNAGASLRSIGSPEIAIVLAEFTDSVFHPNLSTSDPKAFFSLLYQGNGYDDNKLTSVANCRGAVREYFRDQSQGKFKPNFTVVGRYKVSQNHNYYANRRAEFRNETLQLAAQDQSIDWTKFDSDGDGKVDGVIIVFAGCGNNTDSGNGNLHPCTWSTALTENGVTFATQIIDSELRRSGGKYVVNSIGVVCHEMGHMLGLPDMYQTGVSSYNAPGMDVWDIMDYGEYVSGGTYPPGYSAYEKEFMGWIEIPEISSGDYTLKSLPEGGTAYRVKNPAYGNEYYLLEVRNSETSEGGYNNWDYLLFKQSKGNYAGGCPGLLVSHYDYEKGVWENNIVNTDPNRQRITIIPANGHFEILENLTAKDPTGQMWFNELKGHTYPCKNATDWGVLGNNLITDFSSPSGTLYNVNSDGTHLMHKTIKNITQDAADHIAFQFVDSTDYTGTYYLNVDDRGFLTRGADKGTRATVDSFGISIEIASTDNGYTLHYTDLIYNQYLGDNGAGVPYANVLLRTKKVFWDFVDKGNGRYILKNISNQKYFKAEENLGDGAVFTDDETQASVFTLYTPEQYDVAVTPVYRQIVISKIDEVEVYINKKTVLPESYMADIKTYREAAQNATTLAQLKDIESKVVALYSNAKAYRENIERHDDCNSYLFVYFPNNYDENLYYAMGDDGYNYTPLNEGCPIMLSDTVAIMKGIRDPHIMRGQDDKTFYMVATDMMCTRGWDSNRGIVMYKSTDLIHWTHHTVNFPTRFPAWSKVTRVWAPETIWDPNYDNGEGKEKGRYMIYYSLLTTDGKCKYDKVYYSYANDDFTDLLTDPVFLYDRGSATIDADIVYDECDSQYHMIYKNEGEGGICQVTAFSLTAPEGQEGTQWENPSGLLEQTSVAVEGGGLFRLIDSNNWVLMYDCYTSGFYQFCETTDWQKFTLKAQTIMSGMFTPRHGAVIALHPNETEALLKAFPTEGLALRGDANGDGTVTMADVIYIINYILDIPAKDFNEEGADANKDGQISMADAMYDVNYILYGSFPSKTSE